MFALSALSYITCPTSVWFRKTKVRSTNSLYSKGRKTSSCWKNWFNRPRMV